MKRGWLMLALLGLAQAGAYRVQPGDTFWSLARKHGTSVSALQALNPGVLRAGQNLRLPASGAAAQSVSLVPALPLQSVGPAVFQQGQAVYYGGRRDGRTVMTAAHLTLPLGTWVRVTHARTGRSVNVLINDRGPFGSRTRVIDLSTPAAKELGMLSEGVAPVTLTLLSQP
ncbi:RlpA-like double-psi beta-barrel domain-containing protein [Deinococcus navajonensis]|uniref:Probable endolytic peptidoglycan transglycosylase RlpA n=1 Tax=Deinococcus navajonensis TaxID=309884 RepID=A0ABV8XMR6_9DEIO